MRHATAANMRNAFGVESAAHMRYMIFADRAVLEMFPNVARLFRALASAEKIHALSHYGMTHELLGDYCVGFTAPFIYNRTVDNLEKAGENERVEGEELYAPYAAVARLQDEMHAARNFDWLVLVKKSHAAMIKTVLDTIKRDAEDPKLGNLYVCVTCGLVAEGEPPERCPVCLAKRYAFTCVE